jgi:hypothetical protein
MHDERGRREHSELQRRAKATRVLGVQHMRGPCRRIQHCLRARSPSPGRQPCAAFRSRGSDAGAAAAPRRWNASRRVAALARTSGDHGPGSRGAPRKKAIENGRKRRREKDAAARERSVGRRERRPQRSSGGEARRCAPAPRDAGAQAGTGSPCVEECRRVRARQAPRAPLMKAPGEVILRAAAARPPPACVDAVVAELRGARTGGLLGQRCDTAGAERGARSGCGAGGSRVLVALQRLGAGQLAERGARSEGSARKLACAGTFSLREPLRTGSLIFPKQRGETNEAVICRALCLQGACIARCQSPAQPRPALNLRPVDAGPLFSLAHFGCLIFRRFFLRDFF